MILVGLTLVIFLGQPLIVHLKENDFQKLCEILHVNEEKLLKKRWLELIVMLVIMQFIPKTNIRYFVFVVFIVYKHPYFKLRRKFKSLNKALNLQFSIWLRMMEVLLSYHTVPLAIRYSIEAAPVLMKAPLKTLASLLQQDPLNRDIYLNFMKDFEVLNIERSMHHLYRYAVLGSEDASLQITQMVEDNAKSLVKSREQLFESKLNFYSWFGLLPMMLVSISFLGLMFMVLTHLMKGGWNL